MSIKLLVISDPAARHLRLLEQLPNSTEIVTASSADSLRPAAPTADVILNGMGQGDILRELWPLAGKVRWVHSLSAGVEGVLFPELVDSPVPLTNARGVFKESLGEFVIAAALFFAKDLRRMLRGQAEERWDQFDMEELYRQSMGIVGYGELGRAAATRARALGMKIYAVRRRPELYKDDPIVHRAFAVADLREMAAISDYLVVAAPLTPSTRNLVDESVIRAMKPTGVLINIGRGPVIDEAALIRALEEKRIRGAALDVFNVEPLPKGHPFWRLENVLLSPHCADHTATWLDEAMQCFVDNFRRFTQGEPLENVVDKPAGY
jgi:phosphoglycerate dehydrogenase-like enzyme